MATSGLSPESAAAGQGAAAIVLVGGRSSRMGTDKASLVVDGIAMRDRVLEAVRDAGINTVLVAGTEDVPDVVVRDGAVTQDDGTGESQGPLAGIVGAWSVLKHQPSTPPPDLVVVLACDLPWLVADVIRQLMKASDDYTHGAVAHDGERPQPLVAAYRPVALDAMAACFVAGERSLRRCSREWELGVVDADPDLVADADTPADLAGFVVEWPS